MIRSPQRHDPCRRGLPDVFQPRRHGRRAYAPAAAVPAAASAQRRRLHGRGRHVWRCLAEVALAGIGAVANAVKVARPRTQRGAGAQLRRSRGRQRRCDHARDIGLDDMKANVGAKLLVEVASKADQRDDGDDVDGAPAGAGDGGLRLVASGANAMALRGLQKASKLLAAEVKPMAKPVDDDDILNIATIATRSEAWGGRSPTASSGSARTAPPWSRTARRSPTRSTSRRAWRSTAASSRRAIENQESQTCEMESPRILVTDRKINNMNDLVPVLEKLVETKEPLLSSPTTSPVRRSPVVLNKMRGVLDVCAIKSPASATAAAATCRTSRRARRS